MGESELGQVKVVDETKHEVLVAHSTLSDTTAAIQQVLDRLKADTAQLTFVFFDGAYDAEIVARILDQRTQDRGVGGTTAGELSCAGFGQGSITGISLHGSGVRAAVEIIAQLGSLSLIPLVHMPHKLARGIGRKLEDLRVDRHMWISLIDGLSGKEDLFVPFFMQAARRVPLIGGSLGDGDRFTKVYLVHHGRVYTDAAAIVLLEYPYGFRPIHHTHMKLSDKWLTVTSQSGDGRVVESFDGQPALIAYAQALNLSPEQVTPEVIGRNPLGYRFRGRPFPCSILRVQEDGSFLMGVTVHTDERLNILSAGDLVECSKNAIGEAIQHLAENGNDVQAMLLFNCSNRFIEAEGLGISEMLFEALYQAPLCGFNTYGEQFASMHMNHSLTGIVFG